MRQWVFVLVVGVAGCLGGGDSFDESERRAAKKRPPKDKCAKKPSKKKCATTTATVEPTGGTITTPDGLTLEVPYGAVDEPTTLSVTATTLDPDPAIGGGGIVYAFEPEGLVFVRPVEVTLPLPAGIAQPQVYWTKLGSDEFQPIGGQVAGNTIVVSTVHFSLAQVGGPSPDRVITGEQYTSWIDEFGRTSVPTTPNIDDIRAYVGDGTGFTTRPAVAGAQDGLFEITVPNPGDVIVAIDGDPDAGVPDRFLVSSSASVDLGISRGGTADRAVAPGLEIDLTVNGMRPWEVAGVPPNDVEAPDDQLEMLSSKSNNWSFNLEYMVGGEFQDQQQIPAGATSAQILFDVAVAGGSAEAHHILPGDNTIVAQLTGEVSSTGFPYQSMERIGHLPSTFDTTVSTSVAVDLDTSIRDMPKTLDVQWQGDDAWSHLVATGRPDLEPFQYGIGVLAQGYSEHEGFYTGNGDLMLQFFAGSPCPNVDTGALTYGDSSLFGGGTWGDLFIARCLARTVYHLPGTYFAGAGAAGFNSVNVTRSVPALGETLVPSLTPVRDATIDGHDFLQGGPVLGTRPTISWTKPAIGKDAANCTDPANDASPQEACIAHYVINVREMFVQNNISRGKLVQQVITPNTSYQFPDTLEPGKTYTFTIVAVGGTTAAAVQRLRSMPFRPALDEARAATSSGVFGDAHGDLLETQETVAAGLQFPMGLTSTSSHIYWIERGESPWEDPVPHALSGKLWRASLDPGNRNPEVLVENLPDPHSIAVEGNQLFWTNTATGAGDGSIQYVQLDNCEPGACPVITLAENLALGDGFVVRDGDVFWGAPLQVIRAADPCRPDPTATPCSVELLAPDYVVGIAVDSENVYWTNYGDGTPGSGAVLSIPRGGGLAVPIATGGSETWNVHVHPDSGSARRVYWSNQAWQHDFVASIESVPFDNSDPAANHVTVAAGGAIGASEIMKVFGIDATHAYYIDTYDRLMKAPLDGSGPSSIGLLNEGGCPQGNLIVRDGTVYWTDTCSQAVHAVPLP